MLFHLAGITRDKKGAVTLSWVVRFTLVIGIFLTSTPHSTLAFNGERKGFVLGFGLGWGGVRPDSPADPSLMVGDMNLKLGVGISDRLLIYYSGHTGLATDGDVGAGYMRPSVAGAFYLRPGSPSFYFLTELGTTVDLDNYNSGDIGLTVGPTVSLGVGYEVARHWSFELVAGRVFVTEGSTVSDYSVLTLRFGALAF